MPGTQQHHQTEQASRVSLILNNLATSLDDDTVENLEPWCLEVVEEEEERLPHHSSPSGRMWQVHNTNWNHDPAWANQGDRVRFGSELASEQVDGFSASHVLDQEWDLALTFDSTGPVSEEEVAELAHTIEGLVVARLGASLEASVELLGQATRGGSVELPEGTAVLDVVWELQRELGWNQRFRQVLSTHLGLGEGSQERELLRGLLEEVAFHQKRSSSLNQLKKRFQHSVQAALSRDVALEVCQPEPEDSFANQLSELGITVRSEWRQDLLCQSLDQIGV